MWSADNGDQPSPTASLLLPPPTHSSLRSNKKKNRAGVNTGGVVNLFGNGFSGPGAYMHYRCIFFWLERERKGCASFWGQEPGQARCQPPCTGEDGLALPVEVLLGGKGGRLAWGGM